MPHAISLNKAKEMIGNFKQNCENILAPDFRNKQILPECETFDRDAIDMLLAGGAQKLRIHYGMDAGKKVHAILVGVDANGKDITPAGDPDAPSDLIVEQSARCPDDCPQPSDLTS